jgi:integrase
MATTGIEVRHRKACRSSAGGRCNCEPTYRASVFDKASGKLIRKSFPTHAAAKTWRQDAVPAVRRGTLAESRPKLTLREACDAWLDDVSNGIVTTRSGDPYKPGAIRSYRQSLRLRVWDEIGDRPFYAVRRVDLQNLVDDLTANGTHPATVMGAITPLRAVFRRALQRGEIEVLPTEGLKMPAVRSRRDRFATPAEARSLLAALPAEERPIWATAFYAGLRLGELMGLGWDDVDLDGGTISVRWGWDWEYGRQPTKNRQRRVVPIPEVLREYLAAQRLRQKPGISLVFGNASGRPFGVQTLREHADTAWEASGMTRITPHECRHTYASFAIAAGVNAKALCDYMGHSSIQVTYDKYGHLMPGNEAEAAGLLDAYLAEAR